MVVTNTRHTRSTFRLFPVTALLVAISGSGYGVVLPEERADVMYHRYEGGGVVVDGPSLLIRKNFAETLSLSANYYVDNISSASIDVTTSGASKYSEDRTEYSFTATYLADKSLLSAGLTNSDENDYQATSFFFNVSQDMFGDLTTVSLGYARGNDDVSQNGNEEFSDTIDRQNFRVGISQVITTKLIIGLNYETIDDEGFLNNPYRNYRYLRNPLDSSQGYQLSQEVYPATRTSDAISLRAAYYLPYRAAIKGDFRYFTDDWGIDANTYQFSYTQPYNDRWTFEARWRWYEQQQADFYNDLFLFASQDNKDYRARDKELSEFSSTTLGIGLTYSLPSFHTMITRSSISVHWDYIKFDYDNFRNLNDTDILPGEEKLYDFSANIVKLYFSLWY